MFNIMKTVLIVEDEPLHLEKIKTSFKGYENKYRLKTTNFLKTAVHIIKESQPDIVLTDNRLPDGEGREIIKNTQGICPLILMTAYGDEQLAVNAMKEGALDYIVK